MESIWIIYHHLAQDIRVFITRKFNHGKDVITGFESRAKKVMLIQYQKEY